MYIGFQFVLVMFHVHQFLRLASNHSCPAISKFIVRLCISVTFFVLMSIVHILNCAANDAKKMAHHLRIAPLLVQREKLLLMKRANTVDFDPIALVRHPISFAERVDDIVWCYLEPTVTAPLNLHTVVGYFYTYLGELF
jgi:hypothetical protein